MCNLYRIDKLLFSEEKKKKGKILQFQSPQFGLFHHHQNPLFHLLVCHTEM